MCICDFQCKYATKFTIIHDNLFENYAVGLKKILVGTNYYLGSENTIFKCSFTTQRFPMLALLAPL